MMKKYWLVAFAIGIASNIFLMGNVFAAAETVVEVNDLSINMNRTLGDTEEVYAVTASESLESFSLFFSDDNNIELESTSGTSWNVSVKYHGNPYTISLSQGSTVTLTINEKTISLEVVSPEEVNITIDKDLASTFFNKIMDNHEPFTLEAESTTGKTINVERTSSGGNDRYAFSSDTELTNARVVDGTDNIIIAKKGSGYDVSGQYKGMTGSMFVALGSSTTITYGSITVAIDASADGKTVTLDADPTVVQGLILQLLTEKRNLTNLTVDNTVFEIPSNSNLSNINIPAGIADPKVQFVVSGNSTTTNNEITVNDAGTGMTVVFPAGTTITGAGWDGIIELPRPITTTLNISGYVTDVEEAIEIGLGTGTLNFDKPVKLIFPNKAGKRIGFISGGVFTEITANCPSDVSLGGANECKGVSGTTDAYVLTNHFTKFVVYTQSFITSGGGGGGGSSDITAPTISDIKVVAGKTSATITWTTNEPANSTVSYGTTTSYGQEGKNVAYTTSHSITLSDLQPSTTYHYQIKSEDNSRNSSASQDKTFTTTNSEVTGDLNNDSRVDKYDFALMMSNWEKTGTVIGDLNNDQKVDKYDFALMMSNWTK